MSDFMMRPLAEPELEAVYKKYMMQDFPDNERKPLHMIKDALLQDEYDCLGLYGDGVFCGYAFLVRLKDTYLLDYFAVVPERRDAGVGRRFLEMLRAELPAKAAVIIETEDPAFAADDTDKAVRDRRLRFYLRNQCTETGAAANVFGVEYLLLELHGGTHSAEEIRTAYETLYRSFLSASRYARYIVIR